FRSWGWIKTLEEGPGLRHQVDQGRPGAFIVLGLIVQQQAEVYVKNTSRILRSLHIPTHPQQTFGNPTEHGNYPSPSKTQVSLLPPPCDELTTSEPSRSATRVKPPGTMLISLP